MFPFYPRIICNREWCSISLILSILFTEVLKTGLHHFIKCWFWNSKNDQINFGKNSVIEKKLWLYIGCKTGCKCLMSRFYRNMNNCIILKKVHIILLRVQTDLLNAMLYSWCNLKLYVTVYRSCSSRHIEPINIWMYDSWIFMYVTYIIL